MRAATSHRRGRIGCHKPVGFCRSLPKLSRRIQSVISRFRVHGGTTDRYGCGRVCPSPEKDELCPAFPPTRIGRFHPARSVTAHPSCAPIRLTARRKFGSTPARTVGISLQSESGNKRMFTDGDAHLGAVRCPLAFCRPRMKKARICGPLLLLVRKRDSSPAGRACNARARVPEDPVEHRASEANAGAEGGIRTPTFLRTPAPQAVSEPRPSKRVCDGLGW